MKVNSITAVEKNHPLGGKMGQHRLVASSAASAASEAAAAAVSSAVAGGPEGRASPRSAEAAPPRTGEPPPRAVSGAKSAATGSPTGSRSGSAPASARLLWSAHKPGRDRRSSPGLGRDADGRRRHAVDTLSLRALAVLAFVRF